MNNIEKIKNMDIDELTEFIEKIADTADCANCPAYDKCISGVSCKINIKNWLKAKADD